MESSTSADQREEEERHPLLHSPCPLLHSPCHFFEQLCRRCITSCLKCLGLDGHFSSSSADAGKTKTDHQQQYTPPQTETEMKHGEEVVGIGTGTEGYTGALNQVHSGSGPQINRASS